MTRLNHIRRWVIWTGLVLLVIGAKLWLIDTAGSSVPRWDQLDGEGEYVLRPWAEGTLKPLDLWRPHNEHRIVFTKLQALGLTVLNGQWDAYVQMFTNAVLHALLLPVLLSWIRKRITGYSFVVIAIVASTAWLLPLTWENTLQGFQSQFYVLIWLSFLQMRGVLGSDRFGWRWWGGQLCGLLALGAMGSGMLSSMAVLAILILEAVRTRRVNRFSVVTATVSFVWVVLGWLSRTPFPGHDPLRARNVGEVLDGMAQIFSWPMQAWWPVSLVVGTPLVVLAAVWFWKSERDAFERTALGLAVWFTLIAGATVWLRYHGAILSSRYLDQFVIGLILQGIALALLPMRAPARWALLSAWLVGIGLSFAHDLRHVTGSTLPEYRQRIVMQEANTRELLATQDPSFLQGKGMFDLPHPSAEWLWHCWQHASIQNLLPAAVRPPVSMPALSADEIASFPPPPYPVVAASPKGPQHEPWIWRSERQSADSLPILRFRISGDLGDPQAALSMRIVSDAWSVDVEPDGPAPNRWKTINVIRPPGEWWIELSDRDSIASVALTAPVELGWLSWGTEKAIKYHLWFMSIGLALMVGGLLAIVPARVLLRPSV